jgi:glutamyl-tRNA reductase
MSELLYVCGVSHTSAGIAVRESAALDAEAERAVLRRLQADPRVREAAVLATCNRTEIYVVGGDRSSVQEAPRDALLAHTRLGAGALDRCRFGLWDQGAAEHLFRVTAGLESVILGETEIVSQVRRTAETARGQGTVGPLLTALFEHALGAARRARRETAIGAGAISLSSVVAELVIDRCPSRPRRIVVVGAGQLAARLLRTLAGRGVGELVVANRSAAAAHELAARHGATAVALGELGEALDGADAVIVAARASQPVLTVAAVGRRDRRLVVVDLSVPCAVAPAVAALPGVELHDLDGVQLRARENALGRHRAAQAAASLIEAETARFAQWRRQAATAPLVEALWREAERIRVAELARLEGLTEEERQRLDALSRSLVRRLLHVPAQRLREALQAAPERDVA